MVTSESELELHGWMIDVWRGGYASQSRSEMRVALRVQRTAVRQS
jgi:hypothetical protein